MSLFAVWVLVHPLNFLLQEEQILLFAAALLYSQLRLGTIWRLYLYTLPPLFSLLFSAPLFAPTAPFVPAGPVAPAFPLGSDNDDGDDDDNDHLLDFSGNDDNNDCLLDFSGNNDNNDSMVGLTKYV